MKKLFLITTVLLTLASTVAAQSGNFLFVAGGVPGTREEGQVRLAEKVKSEIARLGTGPEARIEVRLHDKTRLKGYLSESNAKQFVVVDSKTGVATSVTYPQVRRVRGNNLSYGAKVAIGFGIAIVALVIFCKVHGCEE